MLFPARRDTRMLVPGEYADTLRAIGRMLDGTGAGQIAIDEYWGELMVHWRTLEQPRHSRRFCSEELVTLRDLARSARHESLPSPNFSRAEQLRTLGTMVDQVHAKSVVIREIERGFWVAADLDGEAIAESLTFEEVALRSRICQLRRRLA
jgi:hypothetical protein